MHFKCEHNTCFFVINLVSDDESDSDDDESPRKRQRVDSKMSAKQFYISAIRSANKDVLKQIPPSEITPDVIEAALVSNNFEILQILLERKGLV